MPIWWPTLPTSPAWWPLVNTLRPSRSAMWLGWLWDKELYYLYNQMWNISTSSLMFQTTYTGFRILKNYMVQIWNININCWAMIIYMVYSILDMLCAYSRFNIPVVEVVTTTTHKSLRGAWGLKQWLISSVKTHFFLKLIHSIFSHQHFYHVQYIIYIYI